MSGRLIHIIPFDIGYSFMDYMDNVQQTKEDFCKKIKEICLNKNCLYQESKLKNCLCLIQYEAEDIKYKCYLLTYGVGIFVLEDTPIADTKKADTYFEGLTAAQLYYKKKREQKELLENSNLPVRQKMLDLMEAVWKAVKVPLRRFSASNKYKHQGISYILTLYEIAQINPKEIDLLMNPDVMYNILDNSKWPTIKEALNQKRDTHFNVVRYGNEDVITASWSSIAIIGHHSHNVRDKVIDYEINLQAAWFLYDCLIDNITKSETNIIDLQNEKSLFTYIDLDISNIISANMASNEKELLQIIYNTSEISILKQKLSLLLENKIAIEKAKAAEKQKTYTIITEILLVIFTLVSIYEPIDDIIKNNIQQSDIFVLIVILIALLCSVFFIIRKEK